MTAKVLVVDDIEANVRLLEVKLQAEYYDVITASDGFKALELAATARPDVILLDVMMPLMDGFEVCRKLKADATTRHIPVVMVTALDGREDRITGLEAGADDFLTKPFDDAILMARVKSLVWLKQLTDELRAREAAGRDLGVIDGLAGRGATSGGRILVADDNSRQAERLHGYLAAQHRPFVETDPVKALASARGPVDLAVINCVNASFDGLRLLAQMRSDPNARHTPVLAIVDAEDRPRLIKALDIGATDVLTWPVDPMELSARVGSQIRRKRYDDALRQNLDAGLELAVTDGLTGLNNRRFLDSQLHTLMGRVQHGGIALSCLIMDIDHFKKVNDSYGHDVGDEVLREFALRLGANVRGIDIACRYGGEEFVIIMPETQAAYAYSIAERIRLHVAGSPFKIRGGTDSITVTISIGVAGAMPQDTADTLMKRADEALYRAKREGRNRVIAQAA